MDMHARYIELSHERDQASRDFMWALRCGTAKDRMKARRILDVASSNVTNHLELWHMTVESSYLITDGDSY